MSTRLALFTLLLLTAFSSGCAYLDRAGTALRPVNDMVAGNRPITYARMMEYGDADERRRGVIRMVDYRFAKQHPYTTRYREMAQNDQDFFVRANAIRALNVARDTGATPIFINALNDPNMTVRLEAAKALANMPDPNAAGRLVAVMNDVEENQDVRIAAAQALKHYGRLDVARALVNQLDEKNFGVAYQSRRSLRKLTSQDFGYDEAAWLSYLSSPSHPLS